MEKKKERSKLQKHTTYHPKPLKPKQNDIDQTSPKPRLLFDAGGTLIFPDQDLLIREAKKHGMELTHEQLYNGYYRLIHRLDRQAHTQGWFLNPPWPRRYASDLFATLNIDNASTRAIAQAADACEKETLWEFTFDWVRETLSQLKEQGYQMSVISNSNGGTEKIFSTLGLKNYFDAIFSSATLGSEKPARAIFEQVLHKLNLRPADALYIGDVFEVDVVGANRVGLGAVHLDPLGLYSDLPGVHLCSIADLPDWLEQYTATPDAFDLFPVRDSVPHPVLAVETQVPVA